MKKAALFFWVFQISALVFASWSQAADASAAQAAYQRGVSWEIAKNYGAAVKEYQAALAADASFFYACRQLGNCYYRLSDKPKALEFYDRYLKVYPGDARVKFAAEDLRRQLNASSPVPDLGDPAFQPQFGFRGLLGYAFGLSGHPYYFDSSISPCYIGFPGSGLLFGGELLYDPLPFLELGLGIFPVSGNFKGSNAASQGGIAATDATTDEFTAMPVILSLYGRFPIFSRNFHLLTGFGLGFAPGGTETTQEQNSGPAPYFGIKNETTQISGSASLDGSLAARAMIGMEYSVTRFFSIFMGLSWLGTNLPYSEWSMTETSKDNNGNVIYQYNWADTFASPPTPTTVGQATETYSPNPIPASGNYTYTYTFTNGSRNYTYVYTYQNHALVRVTENGTESNQKGETYDFSQFGLNLGFVFRF